MSPQGRLEATSSLRIPVSPLDPTTFASFGQVIQNPSKNNGKPDLESVSANQGSATKYIDVTTLTDFYQQSHSRHVGKPVMNMFVCQPRSLRDGPYGKLFDVNILERHPFTPQTFIPLGVSKPQTSTINKSKSQYLIIVAPTLPLRARSERSSSANPPYPIPPPKGRGNLADRLRRGRPNPFTNDFAPRTTNPLRSRAPLPPRGPGLPDLDNLRAFIATGDQAVTYGPGTWHAPMVVLGDSPIEFVVVQYANGVPTEDCQEVEIVPAKGAGGIQIAVEEVKTAEEVGLRAKL